MPPTPAYDAVPYEDYPVTETHVDRLYLHARRAGLHAARPEAARVLELGCAHAVNLMPMAFHLPQARLLGIDLSPPQIERAQARARTLGVENLELRCCDVMALDLGERRFRFDYVIAHGLYSWVPEPVRARVLALCREGLAPSGVAYVSYNAMPAWGIRGAIARALQEGVGDARDAHEQLRRARATLERLEQVQPLEGTAEGALLRTELEALRDRSDSYLLHEYLVPCNRAFYLREMAERAAAAGLRLFGDGAPSGLSPRALRSTREGLRPLGDDPLAVEQLVDIVAFRQFRAALLCRDDAELAPVPSPAALLREGFLAAPPSSAPSPSSPSSPSSADPPGPETALLRALGAHWPADVPLAALAAELHEHEDALVPRLWALVEDERIQLRPRSLPMRPAGERPRVAALSRFEATHLPFVTTPLHEHAPLDSFHAMLIGHLDGEHTREQLVEALLRDIDAGRLQLAGDRVPPVERLRPALAHMVETALQRLGTAGLLVG